jgi:hypothetical protein
VGGDVAVDALSAVYGPVLTIAGAMLQPRMQAS